MSPTQFLEAHDDLESDTSRQARADAVTWGIMSRRGRKNLSWGLETPEPEPPAEDLHLSMAEWIESVLCMILEDPGEVRELEEKYIRRKGRVEDQYSRTEQNTLKHQMREKRIIGVEYIPKTVCSARDIVTRLGNLIMQQGEVTLSYVDQDLVLRFEELCRDQRGSRRENMRELYKSGVRASVLSGNMPEVDSAHAVTIGWKEAAMTKLCPELYLQ